MKKGLLFLLMAVIAFGVSMKSFASARIDSMATDVREVEDIDLIWLYPNKVLEYKNTVDFRMNMHGIDSKFGGGTDEWGGVIMDMPELCGVLGVYINRPYYLGTAASKVVYWPFYATDSFLTTWNMPGGDYWSFTMNSTVDLFYAQNIGDANLGIHLNYAQNGIQNPATLPIVWEENQVELGVGLGFNNIGPFSQLNLHGDFEMISETDKHANPVTHDSGVYSVLFGGLAQADLSDTNYMKVFTDLSFGQNNNTDLLWGGTGYNSTTTTALLGFSCGHKLNKGKDLLNTGLVLDYVGTKETIYYDYSENEWNLIWNASVEAGATDWLTLRAGLTAPVVSRYYESDHSPTYGSNKNKSVYLATGFAINWQNFTLDANVDVASFENSINHAQPGNGLFFTNGDDLLTVTEVDLRYKF
jgi:hypothetical protein